MKKMGRPKLPKRQVKSVLVGAKLSPAEAKQVEDAAKRAGLSKSAWARKTLLLAAATGAKMSA